MPPPRGGERGPFRLSDTDALLSEFLTAGFAASAEPVTVTYEFLSVADTVDYCRATSSPVSALLAERPELPEAAVWERLAELMAIRTAPDGTVRLDNRAVVISAAVSG